MTVLGTALVQPSRVYSRARDGVVLLSAGRRQRPTSRRTDHHDYAVRLGGNGNGGGGGSLTSDRFRVPDWGVLRFDLHVPEPSGGQLEVFLTVDGQKYELGQTDPVTGIEPVWPQVSLEQFDNDDALINGLPSAQEQRHLIDYGTRGFETFHLEVPESLRGEVGELTFQVGGDSEVFLDNVFFKSTYLLFGNPSDARSNPTTYKNNYLLEKPQYTLSYNDSPRETNWVSYQLNKSWFGSSITEPRFSSDTLLPFSELIEDESYGSQKDFNRGHLVAAADRKRGIKDFYSTFFLSNILPQERIFNKGTWSSLESHLKNHAQQGKEVYIITGGRGSLDEDPVLGDLIKDDPVVKAGVNIPSHFWKVALVLEKPGLVPSKVTDAIGGGIVDLIAVDIPNDPTEPGLDSENWEKWKISVKELQQVTGFDFLDSLENSVEKRIEENKDFSHFMSSPLLVQEASKTSNLSQPFSGFIPRGFESPENPTGQDGVLELSTLKATNVLVPTGIFEDSLSEDSVFETGSKDFGSSQVSSSQITPLQIRPSQIGVHEFDSTQVTFPHSSLDQNGGFENRPAQVSLSQVSSTQIGKLEFGSSQVSASKISAPQVDFTQVAVGQIGADEISSFEIDTLKTGFTHLNFSQLSTTEIPLPGSISFQQFLSSHHENLSNATISTWTSFLLSHTPFDLNFAIKDLPTGQLAEAQLTRFDANGHPIAGTILIDDDANDTGWF